MELIIHFDGGSRGNPGPAAAGVVIHDKESDLALHEAGYFLGTATNNVAEYQGLIRALKLATQMGAARLDINSDSELVVKQITGEYRVKSETLTPLFEEAQSMLLGIEAWQIEYVPRAENARADQLANLAMDRKRDVVITHISPTGWLTPSPGGQTAESDAGADSTPPVELPQAIAWDAMQKNAVAPPTRPTQPRCGSPRWIVEFVVPPSGDCRAKCKEGEVFSFGPATPERMCIHAAAVVLDEGPLVWDDPKQREAFTFCPRCGAKMRIERIDE